MDKKIILIPIVIILVSVSSIFLIFSNDDNVEIDEIESTELFDVDHFLKSELIDHTFKIRNTGTVYDRYLIESDYSVYQQNIMLDDPIIKYQFSEDFELDTSLSGPENPNTIVIYPTFTSAAYSEPGFYTYFRGDCDESCITDISFVNPELKYTSSGMGTQLLHTLGYNFISDVDVDKNPEILKNYDTLILLHNEYVTKKMFDAISSHPNIIFLYPNALYAEIEVNHVDQTMTLIRGHNYPQTEIRNGFGYAIEEAYHEYEYDTTCMDWNFMEFENGYALNCYPDAVIWDIPGIVGTLKFLT
ncbi:hypothetical protein OAJ02_03155 [Nitrosopumilus sp.]|nr:hypothetical protein [Nitrosopumilus sp.]